jgi:hypothetical protein
VGRGPRRSSGDPPKFSNSRILADMGLARSTTGIERVKSALDNFHHLLMETRGLENRTVWSTKRGQRVSEKKAVEISNSYYPVPKYTYIREGDDFRSGEGYHLVTVDKTFLMDCIGGNFSLQVRYDMLLTLRGAYAKAFFLFFASHTNRTVSVTDLVRHLRIGDLPTIRRREILKRSLNEMKERASPTGMSPGRTTSSTTTSVLRRTSERGSRKAPWREAFAIDR